MFYQKDRLLLFKNGLHFSNGLPRISPALYQLLQIRHQPQQHIIFLIVVSALHLHPVLILPFEILPLIIQNQHFPKISADHFQIFNEFSLGVRAQVSPVVSPAEELLVRVQVVKNKIGVIFY